MSTANPGRGGNRGGGGCSFQGRGQGRRNKRLSGNTRRKSMKTKPEDMFTLFCLRTARHASDYDTNKDFIINHIQQFLSRSEYPQDIFKALDQMEHPNIQEWEPQIDDFLSRKADERKRNSENALLRIKFEVYYEDYLRRSQAYRNNKTRAYALIWARCSPEMKFLLKAQDDFRNTILNDPLELLKAIKHHTLHHLGEQYL